MSSLSWSGGIWTAVPSPGRRFWVGRWPPAVLWLQLRHWSMTQCVCSVLFRSTASWRVWLLQGRWCWRCTGNPGRLTGILRNMQGLSARCMRPALCGSLHLIFRATLCDAQCPLCSHLEARASGWGRSLPIVTRAGLTPSPCSRPLGFDISHQWPSRHLGPFWLLCIHETNTRFCWGVHYPEIWLLTKSHSPPPTSMSLLTSGLVTLFPFPGVL